MRVPEIEDAMTPLTGSLPADFVPHRDAGEASGRLIQSRASLGGAPTAVTALLQLRSLGKGNCATDCPIMCVKGRPVFLPTLALPRQITENEGNDRNLGDIREAAVPLQGAWVNLGKQYSEKRRRWRWFRGQVERYWHGEEIRNVRRGLRLYFRRIET